MTAAGRREMDKFVTTMRAWLRAELRDWGADDDELLTAALHNIAREIVDEDSDALPPVRESPAITAS